MPDYSIAKPSVVTRVKLSFFKKKKQEQIQHQQYMDDLRLSIAYQIENEANLLHKKISGLEQVHEQFVRDISLPTIPTNFEHLQKICLDALKKLQEFDSVEFILSLKSWTSTTKGVFKYFECYYMNDATIAGHGIFWYSFERDKNNKRYMKRVFIYQIRPFKDGNLYEYILKDDSHLVSDYKNAGEAYRVKWLEIYENIRTQLARIHAQNAFLHEQQGNPSNSSKLINLFKRAVDLNDTPHQSVYFTAIKRLCLFQILKIQYFSIGEYNVVDYAGKLEAIIAPKYIVEKTLADNMYAFFYESRILLAELYIRINELEKARAMLEPIILDKNSSSLFLALAHLNLAVMHGRANNTTLQLHHRKSFLILANSTNPPQVTLTGELPVHGLCKLKYDPSENDMIIPLEALGAQNLQEPKQIKIPDLRLAPVPGNLKHKPDMPTPRCSGDQVFPPSLIRR